MAAKAEPSPAAEPEEQSGKITKRGTVLAVFLLAGVIGVVVYGYLAKPGWVGVAGKQFWDYLELLIVPAALALGVYWLNRTQSEREREAEEARQERERRAEAGRRERELEIEDQRAQDEALQAYLDQIGQMLLDNERPLTRAREGTGEHRTVARARTLTVLPRLNGKRKGTVVQFLYEADLIDKNRYIVDLRGADLSGAKLAGAVLTGARLSGALLSEADLSRTSLSYADLRGADLGSSDLRGAILAGADLSQPEPIARNPGPWAWTDPPATNLKGADLSSAVLQGTNLSGANLSGANLERAAVLHPRAEPPYELRLLAKERGMSLVRPGSDNLELERMTRFLKGTTMPNGQKYEDWLQNAGSAENAGPS